MTGQDAQKATQPIQDSDGKAEGILAVPEDLESRFPEFKRRYLEYGSRKGFPDLPVEESVVEK
jgi:hypothetical protein